MDKYRAAMNLTRITPEMDQKVDLDMESGSILGQRY